MSEADNDASGLNQDNERNETLGEVTLPQCQQESAWAAEPQEAEPSCLNQAPEDGKHVEATKLPSQDESGNVNTVTSLTYSQVEGLLPDPDTDANQNGTDKMEAPTVKCSRSSSQTHTESPQNTLPTSIVALGSCTSASEEQRENSQCCSDGDRETKHKECKDMAPADVPAVMKEEEEVLPPKKKQRTDERATEQSGTEVQSQPIKAPDVSRPEAHGAALTSDGSGVPCGPACFKSSVPECQPRGEPGTCPAAVCSEQQQSSNPTEADGLEFSDCVSDSQLDAIMLTEDLMTERGRRSPECPNATDLICGLIQELSSLNRKVMAAHRELENLHRSGKSSRSFLR